MKKLIIATLAIGLYTFCSAETPKTKETEKLLKELSDNACKCIDSIRTDNNPKEEISKAINRCIDQQTGAYQLGSKLMNIKPSGSSKKDSINIEFNTNKESGEYKRYYFEIERYLMANCQAIKNKIASSDLISIFSVSKNPEAIKKYTEGIEQLQKQNYEKAISFFQKALKVDSLFAFAWDNIGLCYRKLGNYDEAIYAYNKSLILDPIGLMPLQNIAVAYKYKKEYQKALDAYKTLAEIDNKNPEVYYGAGIIYAFNLNNYEQGLDNICRAYNLYIEQKSPYRADAENVINMIYSDMKKHGKEAAFKEILKKNNISQKE